MTVETGGAAGAPESDEAMTIDDSAPEDLTEIAQGWAETVEASTTAGAEFDPRVSVRKRAASEGEVADLDEALERLPRLEGSRDGDRYPALRYLGMLGKGGMGEVRLAFQVPVGRKVAVKQLRRSTRLDTRDRREEFHALLREAWITGFLEHPNIVPIYRVGTDEEGEPVVVMKRIEGVSWQQVLEDPSVGPPEFDPDEPVAWHIETLIQVCNAIEYAHDRGILHRDLKPENVMIGGFGEVYVVDWGIAAGLDAIEENERIPTLDQVTTRVGTPAFMAPEMIEAKPDRIGVGSDIYLLGGILHEILTGEPPNRGDTMIQVLVDIHETGGARFDEEVPGRLADICRRALAPDPDDRYASVADLRSELREFARHRESMALVREASERLASLEALLEGSGAGEGDEREIREAFVTCRFGFEQALELSEENRAARRGFQRLLELMIEREIDREGYEAAAHFLADLPEPRPDLEQRVERLGERLKSRERELEQLQDMRHQTDVEVGRHARSLFVLIAGGLTAALNLAPGLWTRLTGEPATLLVTGSAFAIFAVAVGTMIYYARARLLRNDANRKMMLALLAILVGDAVLRLMQLIWTVPNPVVGSHKSVMVATGFGVLAITMDRRILWLAAAYLLAAPLQLIYPDLFLEIAAAAVLGGTGLLAAAWWPSDA